MLIEFRPDPNKYLWVILTPTEGRTSLRGTSLIAPSTVLETCRITARLMMARNLTNSVYVVFFFISIYCYVGVKQFPFPGMNPFEACLGWRKHSHRLTQRYEMM